MESLLRGRIRLALVLPVLAAALAAAPSALAQAPTPAPGYAVSTYASGFVYSNAWSATVDPATGDLWVIGSGGQLYRFPFGTPGPIAPSALPSYDTGFHGGVGGMTFGADGRLYAVDGNSIWRLGPPGGDVPLYTQDPECSRELALDPLSGDIFSSWCSLPVERVTGYEIGQTPTKTVFSAAATDVQQIAFSPDGTLYGLQQHPWFQTTDIVRVDRTGGTTVVATIPGYYFGLVVSLNLNDPSAPPYLFVDGMQTDANTGIVSRVDLTQGAPVVTTVATGGGVGEYAALGKDGCLYVPQVTSNAPGGLLRITNADGTCLGGQMSPAPLDTTPPTTTADPSPVANAAGWNRTAVTVTLAATDDAHGSGVKATYYSLDDPSCTPTARATCSGYSTPFSVSTEGVHTVTYFSVDKAGNAEAAHTLTVRIDETPPAAPTLSADRAPDWASGGGWYRDTVTVSATANGDPAAANGAAGSGVDPASVPAPVAYSTTGAFTATGTVADLAGNVSPQASLTVQVDATPPAITADAVSGGSPYTAGTWTRHDVVITFHCTDAGSGVASVTAPLTVSTEGAGQTVTGTCTDEVGHTSTATFGPIDVDKTPPEAYVRFDPASHDLAVYGLDALSGVAPGPVAPSSTSGGAEGRSTRTYVVADLAGNTLELTLSVAGEEHELRASVLSLLYNVTSLGPVARNALAVEWSANELGQEAAVGAGPGGHHAGAEWSAERGSTRIESGPPEQHLTLPGQILLDLLTSRGTLTPEWR